LELIRNYNSINSKLQTNDYSDITIDHTAIEEELKELEQKYFENLSKYYRKYQFNKYYMEYELITYVAFIYYIFTTKNHDNIIYILLLLLITYINNRLKLDDYTKNIEIAIDELLDKINGKKIKYPSSNEMKIEDASIKTPPLPLKINIKDYLLFFKFAYFFYNFSNFKKSKYELSQTKTGLQSATGSQLARGSQSARGSQPASGAQTAREGGKIKFLNYMDNFLDFSNHTINFIVTYDDSDEELKKLTKQCKTEEYDKYDKYDTLLYLDCIIDRYNENGPKETEKNKIELIKEKIEKIKEEFSKLSIYHLSDLDSEKDTLQDLKEYNIICEYYFKYLLLNILKNVDTFNTLDNININIDININI